ncbi:MAG: hypothetical protein ACK50E_06070 [Bacteroidota bacterium]|jgi:hypothetical protein
MRRSKLAKYLRYTFPTGVRIVYGLLFTITFIFYAIDFVATAVRITNYYTLSPYILGFTLSSLITHMLLSYYKFKQYLHYND